MRLHVPVLLGFGAFVSARCGTPQPSENMKALHRAYQAHEASAKTLSSRQFGDIAIDTYIHVIQGRNASKSRSVPTSNITDQMDVLNNAYAPAGISFNLVDVDVVVNSTWRRIQYGSQVEYEMKSTLRQGAYNTLNLYLDTIAPFNSEFALLGYATFPDEASPRAFELDGVVIDPITLPGGNPEYGLGITAVHEVGHWLSLFHTFESHGNETKMAGCYGDGDFLEDTPAEASPAFGCQKGRDTCTGSIQANNPTSEPGPDPINNYMDYSDDSCLTQFTEGQITRMQTSFLRSRENYIPGSQGEEVDAPVLTDGPHGG